ncbi:MAG: hypothetical protein ABI591_08745 [Kofleriaceae bacterium]
MDRADRQPHPAIDLVGTFFGSLIVVPIFALGSLAAAADAAADLQPDARAVLAR